MSRKTTKKKNNPVTNGLRIFLSSHSHFFLRPGRILLELDGLRILQEDQLDDFKHEVIITDLSDINEKLFEDIIEAQFHFS